MFIRYSKIYYTNVYSIIRDYILSDLRPIHYSKSNTMCRGGGVFGGGSFSFLLKTGVMKELGEDKTYSLYESGFLTLSCLRNFQK